MYICLISIIALKNTGMSRSLSGINKGHGINQSHAINYILQFVPTDAEALYW